MQKIELQPKHLFIRRFARNLLMGSAIILVSLLVGMIGYCFFEDLDYIDAFLNASMILSGMGQISPLKTGAGKIFAGFYALFSGVIFLVVIAIIFAPVVHRFLHKFHLEEEKKK